MTEQGKIRVGRIRYDKNYKQIIPKYENFENIMVMTKSSEYGSLGPYCLKDENKFIMENIWQFSKLYKKVPATKLQYSRYDPRVIWQWPNDTFIDDNNNILPDYWIWRRIGMKSSDPIRYPVGYNNRSECIGAINTYLSFDEPMHIENFHILNYIDSRKQIYVPLYTKLVKKQKKYKLLEEKLSAGKNLLICEIDCSYGESMPYYKEKYNVPDNFIENYTMEINKENVKLMLNDEKHSFGHGYCLGMALLDIKIDEL